MIGEKYEIKKCECGYHHIYKRRLIPFMKRKPIRYLYNELFCSAWVNRSFYSTEAAELYIKYPNTRSRIAAGEYVSGINESICQLSNIPHLHN
tara:strand:- start:5605 stop:5883 length:279 start_codon:yes stop_codon:yes gene_type:complete